MFHSLIIFFFLFFRFSLPILFAIVLLLLFLFCFIFFCWFQSGFGALWVTEVFLLICRQYFTETFLWYLGCVLGHEQVGIIVFMRLWGFVGNIELSGIIFASRECSHGLSQTHDWVFFLIILPIKIVFIILFHHVHFLFIIVIIILFVIGFSTIIMLMSWKMSGPWEWRLEEGRVFSLHHAEHGLDFGAGHGFLVDDKLVIVVLLRCWFGHFVLVRYLGVGAEQMTEYDLIGVQVTIDDVLEWLVHLICRDWLILLIFFTILISIMDRIIIN